MPNISEYCSVLPKIDERHITRAPLVQQLKNVFDQGTQIVTVLGPSGFGKTNLLYDFTKSFSDSCISFFIGTDSWRSSPTFFLAEVCKQMQIALNINNKEIIDNYDYDSLKRVFLQYYSNLSRLAKRSSSKFYFVIDGLDRVVDNFGQDTILTLLPHDPFEGICTLVSCNDTSKITFPYYPYPITIFSDPEIKLYFSDLSLDESDLQLICSASGGIPGYISHIYQELIHSDDKSLVLLNLPDKLSDLYARQWDIIKSNEVIRNVFALLTYFHNDFSLTDISNIINIDIAIINGLFPDTFFTMITPENTLQFRSDAYKSFMKNQLQDLETHITLLLIKYYESNISTRGAVLQLPRLYSMSGNYNKLSSIINSNFIKNAILLTRQPPLIKSHLRILDNESYKKVEWSTLIFGVLAEAILSSVLMTPYNYDEIQALLTMGEHDDAIDRAMRAFLPEDRVYLLSCIVKDLYKNNLPISDEIYLSIKNELCLINIEESNIYKLVEGAVNIYPIDISLSMLILECNSSLLNSSDLLDAMHGIVAMRLIESEEDIGDISTRIQREDMRDFVNALSNIKRSANSVIEESGLLHSTKNKIKYFRSWLNSHMEDSTTYQVIEEALNIIVSDNEYIPSIKEIRELAQPLLYCNMNDEIKIIVEQINRLKDTLIRSPLDEYYYLELIIARVENGLSIPYGIDRCLEATIYVNEIDNYDTKAHALIHILNNIKYIFPNDKVMINELEETLTLNLKLLLESSACHDNIAERLIPDIVNYDPYMALSFASNLNTKSRRNRARKLILKTYTKKIDGTINANFIGDVLDAFDNEYIYESALLDILNKFVKFNNSNVQGFYSRIHSLKHPVNLCKANAYLLMWIGNNNSNIKDEIKKSLSYITDKNVRIEIEFNLAAILAKHDKDFAKQLFDEALSSKNRSIIYSKNESSYIVLLKLIIRLVPDIIKDEKNNIAPLILEYIEKVNSIFNKCNLLNSLGLKYLNNNKMIFQDIVYECLRIINDISNNDITARNMLITICSPIIYEHERNILYGYFNEMNEEEIDNTIQTVFTYIVTKLDPNDSVDIEQMPVSIDHSDTLKLCELITWLKNDNRIYYMISTFVMKVKQSNEQILEKSILGSVESLVIFIKKSLPDQSNIKHNGYYICCLARLRSLKKAVYKPRADWDSLVASWTSLIKDARDISNIADRIFVISEIALCVSVENMDMAIELLDEASKNCEQIKNIYDRIDRLELIANAYKKISIIKSSKFYLENAFNLTSLFDDDEQEKYFKSIIELAHSIDPQFGIELANRIDNPYLQRRACDNIKVMETKSNPSKNTKGFNYDVMEQMSLELFSAFISGRIPVNNESIIGTRIYDCAGMNIEIVEPLVKWFIENSLKKTRSIKVPQLTSTYNSIIDLLNLINLEPETEASIEASATNSFGMINVPRTNIMKVLNGEKDRAIKYIEQWMIDNVKTYLKIYDPYFGPEQIKILSVLPHTIMIKIITTWKALHSQSMTNTDIRDKYCNIWRQTSDQNNMKILLVIIGTDINGNSKEHDRFFISDNTGLSLGISINGLGSNDTYIQALSCEEKGQIERETFDSLFSNPPTLYKGQPLRVEYISLFS